MMLRMAHKRSLYHDVLVSSAVAAALILAIGVSKATAFVPTFVTSSSSDVTTCSSSATATRLYSATPDLSAEQALERTKAHLAKLQRRHKTTSSSSSSSSSDEAKNLHPQQQQSIAQETLYQEYIVQSANSLKQELERLRLNTKGRKPDLARRLAMYNVLQKEEKQQSTGSETVDVVEPCSLTDNSADDNEEDSVAVPYPVSFAGISLSQTAATALHQAGFLRHPSPIQQVAIPAMAHGESVLLHAPTGSGKTLAYVLPITEFLWRMQDDTAQFAVVCTPTRELAAQVAGVASTLAPPGSVRLLSHPSNLMTTGVKDLKHRNADNTASPRIFVGSAKTILHSLYGNDDYPTSPTPKPLALQFLKSVRVLVLDEVDRLLGVQGSRRDHKQQKQHEKPAAILAAAVARHTLGGAQVVAASATVGRPLKRELARVLGLPPPQGPRVIVAQSSIGMMQDEATREDSSTPASSSSRLVTIPDTVEHYIAAVAPNQQEQQDDGTTTTVSSGQLLIRAYQVIQDMNSSNSQTTRILMVLARGFGISTQQVIGALKHFNCQPEPQSLLDALHENALEGTDHMMQVHRQVSGATGVGQSTTTTTASSSDADSSSSSLWVTGEDTVRGLHLDGLDAVVLVGRPKGPDEYTHIAGRTGRAGRSGKVVAVVPDKQAPLLRAWETMLQMEWKDY